MSEFGVIGLGVMGSSISLNLLDHGFELSVYNREQGGEGILVQQFVDTNKSKYKFKAFTDLKAFVESLQRPRRILVMIKAGVALDSLIEQILPLIDEGDILIDGGNSLYKDTERRARELKRHGIHFFGCGISGGEKGARYGPSIMPGGNKQLYQKYLAKYLEAIAAKDTGGKACCSYIGEGGAGHFVKMIHNGIEYAEMQLIVELFDCLKSTHSYEDISKIFESWKSQGLDSYLLDITIDILNKKEEDDFLLDKILDRASNKGTGAWSSIAAFELGSVNTMMASSVFARYISSFKSERERFHVPKAISQQAFDLDKLRKAYQFARIINHHQGFEILSIASKSYSWDLNLQEICRVWTNGCIIRSGFMNRCIDYFAAERSLLNHEFIMDDLRNSEQAIVDSIKKGLDNRIPLPCLGASLDYWVSITTRQLPANLIQAMRDYFGAHRYQRNDSDPDELFHTNWEA